MKDLVFNELTQTPLALDFPDAIVRVEQFLRTYRARPEKLFNRGIRLDKHIGEIPLTEELTTQNLVSMGGRARTLGTILLSLGRFPYLEEDSLEEEQFILNQYYCITNGNKHTVIGLAAAYLQNTFAIGFESEAFWKNCNHSIVIENVKDPDAVARVVSVSSPEHFSCESALLWIQNHAEIELVKSTLDPKEKQIHLRDDHGFDILISFARRLLKNCYVDGVVNSCEFSPHNRRFIRAVNNNGIIEITLPWTDQGLGIAVQTTGRNLRETERIAEIVQGIFLK